MRIIGAKIPERQSITVIWNQGAQGSAGVRTYRPSGMPGATLFLDELRDMSVTVHERNGKYRMHKLWPGGRP